MEIAKSNGENVTEISSVPPPNLWDCNEPNNLKSFGCYWLYYIRGLILAKSRKFKEAEISLDIAKKSMHTVFGIDPNEHPQGLKFTVEIFSLFEMWKQSECISAARSYFETVSNYSKQITY